MKRKDYLQRKKNLKRQLKTATKKHNNYSDDIRRSIKTWIRNLENQRKAGL